MVSGGEDWQKEGVISHAPGAARMVLFLHFRAALRACALQRRPDRSSEGRAPGSAAWRDAQAVVASGSRVNSTEAPMVIRGIVRGR